MKSYKKIIEKYEKKWHKYTYDGISKLNLPKYIIHFLQNRDITIIYHLIDKPLKSLFPNDWNNEIINTILKALYKRVGFKFEIIEENNTKTILPDFIVSLKNKAESGDPLALFEYSEYFLKFHNLKKSHFWNTKAAQAGYPEAMFNEGCFILFDWVPGTLEESFEYHKKAAEKGFKESYYELAYCYLRGCGVEQNFAKAKDYFIKHSRWKNKRIIKDLSSKDFKLKGTLEEYVKRIRDFYN